MPSFKMVYSLSSRSKLSAYWSYNNTSTPNNNGLPGVINGTPTINTAQTVRLNFDQTLTPTLLLHAGAGLLYPIQTQTPPRSRPRCSTWTDGNTRRSLPVYRNNIRHSRRRSDPRSGKRGQVVLHQAHRKCQPNLGAQQSHLQSRRRSSRERISGGQPDVRERMVCLQPQ